jgi:hypothetical protein
LLKINNKKRSPKITFGIATDIDSENSNRAKIISKK